MKFKTLFAMCLCVAVAAPLFAQGPPAQSGTHVFRDEAYGWWWVFTDWRRGYVAVVGRDIVAFCNDEDVASWWTYQDNYAPAEEDLLITNIKGDDVITSVWPVTIWEYADPCEYILNNTPIADGTSDAILTDNDVYAWLYDHNRKNAYGLSAHGVLTAPDGERMIFNGHFRCVFDADAGTEKCNVKIVLN